VQATYYVDEGLIEVITDGVAGDSGPTLGGPGDGSLGTSDKYIAIDSVIEHGDLSGQGGIMHDASQISIVDDGEYFASGNVEAMGQEIGASIAALEAGGSFVLQSILTTVGDIFVRGSGGISRLAAPVVEGQVITSDPAQPLGMKWADPSATGSTTPALLVATGVVPLEPVGESGNPDNWLYASGSTGGSGSGSGTSDHGALSGLGDFDHDQYLRGESGRIYRAVAGTLRKTGGSWGLLTDSGHRPLGLASVSADATKITVTYDFTATKVGALLVTPDETWAASYLVGASVGLTTADIYIKDLSGAAVAPSSVADSATANFWIIGLLEV
jgi:hypothetical protein